MRKLLLRVGLPGAIASVAILVVLSTASDGPDGERTATAADASGAALAKPIVDPQGRPARSPRRPHVVMLILDELPADSLLGPDGRIDALRWPSLAGLARNAHWFPNAFTVYDSTPKAVPAILDGKRPRPGLAADPSGHPRTLFDFFGRMGYRVRAKEEATRLCPPRWCPGAGVRPRILHNLHTGRAERFRRFIESVRPSRRPTFWLQHALLPHGPFQYLSSGARSTSGRGDPVPRMSGTAGFHDEFLTRHNEQRYLLQLGYVDRQLGRLFERLESQGMFDSTMIVVVADHGLAWKTKVKDRRKVSSANVHEVGPVPLFIKAPGQRRGQLSRSYVSTLDVAPTIADLLNARLPYRADGHSAFSRRVRGRRSVSLPVRDFSATVRVSSRTYERRRRAVVRRRLRMFGSGLTGLYGGIGPNRELVGRAVSELLRAGGAGPRAQIAGGAGNRSVRRSSGLVPAHVAGNIRGGRGRGGAKRDIAVAVNGRVEAVGRSFYLRGDRSEHFAVMVPEDTLREGRNGVEVFEVARGPALRLLARL